MWGLSSDDVAYGTLMYVAWCDPVNRNFHHVLIKNICSIVHLIISQMIISCYDVVMLIISCAKGTNEYMLEFWYYLLM